MIAVSGLAVRESTVLLSSEMGFAEGTMVIDDITPGSDLIHNTRIVARDFGEPIIRLAFEWMLKGSDHSKYSYLLLHLEPEDFVPLLERVYQVIWGEVPKGGSPQIAVFNFRDEVVRPQDRWAACRDRIYGDTQHDLPRLRELAALPHLVDGQGRPMSDIPCEGAYLY